MKRKNKCIPYISAKALNEDKHVYKDENGEIRKQSVFDFFGSRGLSPDGEKTETSGLMHYIDALTEYRDLTGISRESVQNTVRDGSYITQVFRWQSTKQIFVLDKSLEDFLYDTVDDSNFAMPVDSLMVLPFDAMYIKTNHLMRTMYSFGMRDAIDGFFVSYDFVGGAPALLITAVADNDNSAAIPFSVTDILTLTRGSINDSFASMGHAWPERLNGDSPLTNWSMFANNYSLLHRDIDFVKKVIKILLYISASNADVQYRKTVSAKPKHDATISFSEIKQWDVGSRIGPPMRRQGKTVAGKCPKQTSYTSEGTGNIRNSPRPHMRSAHYHHYWMGKKSEPEKRHLVIRFVAAIMVNGTKETNEIENYENPIVYRGVLQYGDRNRIFSCGGTSYPEQKLYEQVLKIWPDAENGYHADWLGKREIDVFIPSLNVGIEYDGVAWHNDAAKDDSKSELCKAHGTTLYRIRENGCPELKNSENCIVRQGTRESDLDEAISSVICSIKNHCPSI